ncbi:MAG TPA: flavin reductase family protein [Paenisporosarcina sp.]|nr:flavin reductase family protein [Paenisporosarcina sp.]
MLFITADKNNTSFPELFRACIVPRPIGWITTQNLSGKINLAPYSYFNAVADSPPMIIFSTTSKHCDGRIKDTIDNVDQTREFVINAATYALRHQLNITAINCKREVDETKLANLNLIPSKLIHPPRIAGSPFHLECVLHEIIQLPQGGENAVNKLVIGKALCIHIDEGILTDGRVDIEKFHPIARLGYMDYTIVKDKFEMKKPFIQY